MREQTAKDDRPAVTPELIERARAKDREAMTALYEATSLEIYRTIHALIKDEDLTLDVQQDTYLQAFSRLDQLREPEAFLPWLRRIAVNEARTALRRKRPLLFSEISAGEEGEEPELPEIRPVASPELELDRKETSRLIREILSGLSDGQRMLLGMFYYEQIPIQKIAEDTGLSPGTVKSQLFRGRRKVETAVKRLEEQGVKLYGLSPLPFLLALLKKQSPAAETGKTLLADTLTRAGAAPLAEAAAVHVGRSFFQTALGRVVLGLIAAGAIGGGIAGYSWARDNILVGDVRTPTSVESGENLHYDSDEDLTTESITTEPIETEPKTTEPIETEPKTTEPETTAPTESEPSNPANPKPNQPADPTPTNPAAPTPTDPAAPTPTESQPTAPVTTSALLGWSGLYSSGPQKTEIEYNDCSPGSYDYLILYVQGGETPSLYSDNEAVTSVVRYQGKEDLGGGKWGHHWELGHKGSGTANVYCTLNGATTKIARTNNPEHEPGLGYTAWMWWGETETITDAKLGSTMTLFSRVIGSAPLELVSDAPSMFTIRSVAADQTGQWYEKSYGWNVIPTSTGTAHLYLKLGGSTVKTFTITVLEADPPAVPDSLEDLDYQP